MSIESSLVKLANKIDADGASNVSPEYKNPNNSVEKSLERIADNYEAGGGGGGVLVVNDNNGTLDKTWQEIANTGFAIMLDDSVPFLGTQIYALANFKADEEDSEYSVSFSNLFNTSAENETYTATSADGYPEADK